MRINLKDFIDLVSDAKRRDLTINSIAKNIETGEYIDPFDGMGDIKYAILRHTSDAFAEDPLRVVRLARFQARYPGFHIHETTAELAQKMIAEGQLNHLPFERFWAELEKVIHDVNAPVFFDVLFHWGAEKHVEFFSKLFSNYPDFRVVHREILALEKDRRLLIFMGLCSTPKGVRGASTELLALAENIKAFVTADFTDVNSIYNLMKVSRAWSEGMTFNNLLSALAIFSELAMYLLKDTAIRTRQIRADMFPHLEGKQLGQAIEVARKEIIAKVFKR